MSTIDRRRFLTGAGSLTAAALAGGAALALAEEAPSAAADSAPADAPAGDEAPAGDAPADAPGGGAASNTNANGDRPDYPWDAEAPEITDDMIEDEIDADVIVVGAGVAGCVAIRSAAEEGAKVIWFEKTEGSTAPGRQFAIINSESMNKVWGNYDLLDRDDVVDHEMDEGGYFGKRSIYTKWFDHSGEVFDWYISLNPDLYVCKDMYDVPPNGEEGGYAAPLCWPQPEEYDFTQERYPTYPSSAALSGRELDAQALEVVESQYGGKGYYGYRVDQLIREDDKVTGVYAYDYATGKYVKANAADGVILACGDFSANDEFVKYFIPDQYYDSIPRMGFFQDPDGLGVAQGEGLVMGDWIGAKIQQHPAIMSHHMGSGPLGCTPFLELNKDGKRFYNEDVPGQQIENQLERQRDMTAYLIFDANWPQAIPYMPAGHGIKCYYIDDDQVDILDGMIEPESIIYPSAVEDGVEAGTLLKADTLEELFAQIDIDAETALASVERYNELCANGYDEDFGKKASRLFPIETGPFYCATFTPAAALVCLAGLESDEDCHVYDRDRNIIPGLYVAGNMQGDRFTTQYPIAVCGIDRSMCVYYGYVAGKNAVAGV